MNQVEEGKMEQLFIVNLYQNYSYFSQGPLGRYTP
jgi:hypothetical protein